MNKVTRGERYLQRLVDDGCISDGGRDWLTAAIDPFHDHQLQHLAGWPDVETGASVVRCVKQSIQVSKPITVGLPPGNWDCHIIQWPWLTASTTASTSGDFAASNTRLGNTFSYADAPSVYNALGGVDVFACAPGSPLNLLNSPGTCSRSYNLSLDPTYTQGAGRLLGIGFEVHNTTSQLNVQGSCTVYRQMANAPSPSSWVGVSSVAGNYFNFSATTVRRPPTNQADALLLSGSKQWEAKDGCYVVGAFYDCENPAFSITPTSIVIPVGNNDDQDATLNTSQIYYPIPTSLGVAPAYQAAMPFRCHPIHQSGAIFTGLSETTTLTLNWNVYYEVFPAGAESAILPLATPSCEFDPDALDLYSRIAIDLPVGVMVKENGLGDWFLDAASKAASFIGPALTALPHPIAKGAGAALTYLGNTGQDYVKKTSDRNAPNSWESKSGGGFIEQKATNRAVPAAQPKRKNTPKKKAKR